MQKDSNITETLNCVKSVDPGQSIACMDENKIPVMEKAVFGGITRKQVAGCKLDDTPDKCKESLLFAKVMSVTYLLQNDDNKRELYEAYELLVIQKLIETFNAHDDTEFLRELMPDLEVRKLDLKITYLLERSIGDELVAESRQNMFIVVVSYILMFVYVSLSLGDICSFVKSNVLLALTSIGFILASVYMSYCVCGFLDIKASLISVEVIPFLILAIGVDNLFLIHSSISSVEHPNIESKIAAGLRNISTSITLSTMTQILTFAVGLYIEIPALRTFCLTAIFALFFNYAFQISAIPCLIAIDLTRQMDGRWDLLPFIKSKEKRDLSKKPDSFSIWFFRQIWKPFILHKAVKVVTIAIIIVSASLFFFALYDMELGLDQQLPVLENGNLYQYFGDLKKYIEMGPIGSLIIQNADYEDPQTIKVLDDLIELISRRKGLTIPPWRVWYKGVLALKDNTITVPKIKNTCFPNVDPDLIINDFEELTDYFLKMDLAHPCCKEFGICGGQFYEDIERKSVS